MDGRICSPTGRSAGCAGLQPLLQAADSSEQHEEPLVPTFLETGAHRILKLQTNRTFARIELDDYWLQVFL